ncbi:pyridoxamine 5'-phosphate oxidase family protein [Streptomyces sp. NEAU-sy36]|uniref:helix-turn-helix domain-containing protein n=1 Tax=unclassified Streptomyces TaxID=2593676 RepID=UPI0015D5F29C|nr:MULTISPECIES: pyridoxamine 5'-phosphate oxidase family protein [unclassified Streptomyces]QLJ02261.1 pyridoxamine 5'-phosphate oxidase family protein [Streptomyces sp. NEAU-sy36]
MAERPTPRHGAPDPEDGPPRSDLGRRLRRRRAELGLTREEVAARAGMAEAYVAHLEEHSTAAPDSGTLLRLAGALRTTPRELGGGYAGLPAGLGQASRNPRLDELSEQECRELLSTHGVGRFSVSTEGAPVVLPVNYTVVDGAIVFRTREGSVLSEGFGREVAFEVDRVDDALSQGWSVLVHGTAQPVTDRAEAERLAERAYSEPWAGGERDLWVRIEPTALTGRRIEAG